VGHHRRACGHQSYPRRICACPNGCPALSLLGTALARVSGCGPAHRRAIDTQRRQDHGQRCETFYTYDRSYGSFTRTFTLPEQTDGEHVKAELKNGELTVVVPKTPAAVAKRIPVASGDKPKA
jgi:hypothetical protein